MSKRAFHFFIFTLIASILTNAVGWAFSGEVFTHAIESEHHVLSLDPEAHLQAHQNDPSGDHGHSNTADFCIHAAGQCLPFFFYETLVIPAPADKGVLVSFISDSLPEFILDSPLRPPKHIFAS